MPFGSLNSGATGSPEPSTLPSAGDSNPTSGAFSAPVFHPNFPGPTRGIFCQFGGRQFITIQFHTGVSAPRPQPVYLDGPCCSCLPRTLFVGRKPRISAQNQSSCLRRVAQNHLWSVFLPSVFSNSFCDPSWRKFTNSQAKSGLIRMNYPPGPPLPSEPIAMKTPARFMPAMVFLLVALLCVPGLAAEPTPPRSNVTQPRTGQTQKFGSGSLTHRSDGTSSQTRPFGSGSITTERTRDGKTVTGHTQKFGSGTITRWSDGSRTETRPFGSGSVTTERGRDGKTVTGQTQKFGSGTITRRSDGSSTRTEKFGSGTLQRDQPGRKSR